MSKLKQISLISLLIFLVTAAVQAETYFDWDTKLQDQDIVKTIESNTGLKVLWWNIHNGRINNNQKNSDILSNNILKLINSVLAPDVLAFAEFSVNSINSEVLKKLRINYPFENMQSYPDSNGYGVVLFSKIKFKISSNDVLDYIPLNKMSSEEKKIYRKKWCNGMCKRNLTIYELEINNKITKIIPMHLYDCWRKFNEINGRIQTGIEVLTGTNNPLWFQINRLLQTMKLRLGDEIFNGNIIIIGDFNMPKEIMRVETTGYDRLSEYFFDTIEGNAPSFPSKKSEEFSKFPAMQIDHSFVSENLRSSKGFIFPLRGSDHYPIYTTVDL